MPEERKGKKKNVLRTTLNTEKQLLLVRIVWKLPYFERKVNRKNYQPHQSTVMNPYFKGSKSISAVSNTTKCRTSIKRTIFMPLIHSKHYYNVSQCALVYHLILNGFYQEDGHL